MSEKINLTNPELSTDELAAWKEVAGRLAAAAPDDVMVQRIVKSLELGYVDSAKRFYQSQKDKFRQIPQETRRIIEEEIMKNDLG